MNQEGLKRKLPAIISADVVSYSRLMGDHVDKNVQMFTV